MAEWQRMDDSVRVTTLDYACTNGGVGRLVEMIWRKQFVASACTA